MYGLIKTHKPDNPVRPIIRSIGSCSYEVSKWLAQQLSSYIGTISNSHIINSLDLVSKLSTLNVKYNYNLVSFDVKSLFTNVPVDSLLHFMKNEFSDSVFPINLDDFIELIRLCACERKFSFEDEFFLAKIWFRDGKLSFTRV